MARYACQEGQLQANTASPLPGHAAQPQAGVQPGYEHTPTLAQVLTLAGTVPPVCPNSKICPSEDRAGHPLPDGTCTL